MSIQHHPDDTLLIGFASGTLDLGQHIAVATHLSDCSHCRVWVQGLEQVGGALLEDLPPAKMSNDAFACVEMRLSEPAPIAKTATVTMPRTVEDVKRLPPFVGSYPAGPWRWIAPRMYLAPILLPRASETRVFLLKSRPGTKLLDHTHTGIEMTCVLQGGFSHNGKHFGPGDFDLGDPTMSHRVYVEPDEDCVCLIAMQGGLRLSGFIGFMLQPLLRV